MTRLGKRLCPLSLHCCVSFDPFAFVSLCACFHLGLFYVPVSFPLTPEFVVLCFIPLSDLWPSEL